MAAGALLITAAAFITSRTNVHLLIVAALVAVLVQTNDPNRGHTAKAEHCGVFFSIATFRSMVIIIPGIAIKLIIDQLGIHDHLRPGIVIPMITNDSRGRRGIRRMVISHSGRSLPPTSLPTIRSPRPLSTNLRSSAITKTRPRYISDITSVIDSSQNERTGGYQAPISSAPPCSQ